MVHSANRTRTSGPGRLRSAAAVNVACGDLVGREAELRRAPQRLGDDARQRVRAAPDRRAVHDACPGAVATDDVAGVGQAAIDRADRVGVDSQHGAELPHRREARAGLEAAGLDLVGELPVDLGADRDVGVALDIELVAAGRPPAAGGRSGVTAVRSAGAGGPLRLLDTVD